MDQLFSKRTKVSIYFNSTPRGIHIHNSPAEDALSWLQEQDCSSVKLLDSRVFTLVLGVPVDDMLS